MRVLVTGDSPTVSTGFSRCTRSVCDALLARGHEPVVLGINEYGGPTGLPYDVHPCRHPLDGGNDAFGTTRMPLLIDRLRPDIVLVLQDPWNIAPYFENLDAYFKGVKITLPPVVAWLAVDSLNHFTKPLNRLAHVVCWTQFGIDQIVAGGYTGPTSIVPLGVDHDLFKPMPQLESRQRIGLTDPDLDSLFIVGVVGRNQHRKRLDLTIESFAAWVNNYDVPNARLLLHVAPTGDVGCNVRALAHHYGLTKRVLLSEPHIGVGNENAEMPYLYSAMDLYLSTSQAEGWGLPALEAMACGVPCVLPDFAAFNHRTGWTDNNCAWLVPCEHSLLTAPMNIAAYTIGKVPAVSDIVAALNFLYLSAGGAATALSRNGLVKAAEYSWERTGQLMVDTLEQVVGRAAEQVAERASIAVPQAQTADSKGRPDLTADLPTDVGVPLASADTQVAVESVTK